MDKLEKEYRNNFGTIPKNDLDRLFLLIDKLKIKKHAKDIFSRINHIMNMKYNKVEFTIYLEPKATPRPRSSRGGHIFYVKGAADNRKRFRKFINSVNLDLIYTPTKLTCKTFFKIPSSMNKVEQILAEMRLIPKITKPDWDNLGKTYSDMIQEQLLYDDSIIFKSTVEKWYSSKPRIEITLEYMSEFDSQFNEHKILNSKNFNLKEKED